MTPCDLTPWEHLRVTQTSHRESGRTVRFTPKPGERVCMFPADTEGFRDQFGNKKSCDVLFLVERNEERVLAFIELKGRNFEEAVEQLAETLLSVRRGVSPECRQSTSIKAMVVSAGGTPSQETRKAQESFRKRTGVWPDRKSLPQGKALELRDHI